MLESMSTALPRAHEYTTILRTPRLHTALREVYHTVIDACIVILECLLSKQCCMPLLPSFLLTTIDFQDELTRSHSRCRENPVDNAHLRAPADS